MASDRAIRGAPSAATAARRITRILNAPDEYPIAQACRIASRFALPTPVETYDFPDKGNINQHTFLIRAGRDRAVPLPEGPQEAGGEFLIQKINQQVFTRPRHVMEAMIASIRAQRAAIERGGLQPGDEWEPITLVPTRGGQPYLGDVNRREESCWRLMVKIPEARTFKSLGEIADPTERTRVAEEAGRGLALYGDFTADMDVSGLENPLPGYRETRIYYAQLRSVLAGRRDLREIADLLPTDPIVRQSTESHFLVHLPEAEYRRRTGDPDLRPFMDLAVGEERFGTKLLDGMESGTIRRLAIHGDTKLDNFLFSTRTGRVKALVDLDTIMPHTWLADWGDMVRSLVNVAGEKETDLSKVQVDMGIYEAVARGFLGTARKVTPAEVSLMADAVEIIALELGVRFLSDHLRGDTYFRLGPADPTDLNKRRAMVQLTLVHRLREKRARAERCILGLSKAGASGGKP